MFLRSFDFLVHSVGDGATSEALAAIAAAADANADTRHRSVYAQMRKAKIDAVQVKKIIAGSYQEVLRKK